MSAEQKYMSEKYETGYDGNGRKCYFFEIINATGVKLTAVGVLLSKH